MKTISDISDARFNAYGWWRRSELYILIPATTMEFPAIGVMLRSEMHRQCDPGWPWRGGGN